MKSISRFLLLSIASFSINSISNAQDNQTCATALSIATNCDSPAGPFLDIYGDSDTYPNLITDLGSGCGYPLSFPMLELWYTFTAPNPSFNILLKTLEVFVQPETILYPEMLEVYSGSCSGLNILSCNYTDNAISLAGLTVGQTYYLRILDINVAAANNLSFDAKFRIAIGEFPVVPSISSPGSLEICNGNNVLLEVPSNSDFNYQWILNGDSIVNATSANYTAAVAGTYCLGVTNSSGCWDISDSIVVTNCVGFETLSSSDIALYPNPASQLLTMEIPSNHRISSIEILDMQGRTIHVQAYNSSNGKYQVPISEISNGIYFISINTDQGYITKRFVKSE
jgi:hypothetical protein